MGSMFVWNFYQNRKEHKQHTLLLNFLLKVRTMRKPQKIVYYFLHCSQDLTDG